MKRWLPVVVGVLLFVFGLACVNYTKPGTLQHHQEWASQHGRPAPSNMVLWAGIGSAGLGGFGVGWGLRRPG